MGYDSGTISSTGQKYTLDAFRIGECTDKDKWEDRCTGGCNDYTLGDVPGCASCGRDQGNGITIKCSGGSSTKTTSCEGGKTL